MLFDFESAHKAYLVGFNQSGTWAFNKVNPGNDKAWFYLASEQFFSNQALNVAVGIRNEVNHAGVATSVHTGLLLSFSTKRNGRYLLRNDPDKLSVVLDLAAVRHLYSWLQGEKDTFEYHLARAGSSPKALKGFQTGGTFACTLRITHTPPQGEYQAIDVGLDDGHVFALSMFCISYAKLLYPSITDSLISQHLLLKSAPGRNTEHSHANKNNAPNCHEDRQIQTGEGGTAQQRSGYSKTGKAIYAVGMNKWPHADKVVISFIQETASQEVMDRLIKAGNRGDFSEWDNIRNQLMRNDVPERMVKNRH